MDITINLPWPAKELSPNARPHYFAKARKVKEYKEAGYYLTKAKTKPIGDGPVCVHVTFHPKVKRRRDIDNLIASIKSGFDGIAAALECDDSNFAITAGIGDVGEGGRVAVRLTRNQVGEGMQ